jgi:20S proteasome alpha/beta subunit
LGADSATKENSGVYPHQAAQNALKTDFVEDLPLSEAVPLVVKVLAKVMDTSLATDKVELSTVSRNAAGQVGVDFAF